MSQEVAVATLDQRGVVTTINEFNSFTEHADAVSHGMSSNFVLRVDEGRNDRGGACGAAQGVQGTCWIGLKVRWDGNPCLGKHRVGNELCHQLVVSGEFIVENSPDLAQLSPGESSNWAECGGRAKERSDQLSV